MTEDIAARRALTAWSALRGLTPARVALGRTGFSLPTREILGFGHAHALARDAVHAAFDVRALEAQLHAIGLDPLSVSSAAPDRPTYLRRPDLGRRLSDPSRTLLMGSATGPHDLAIVVADGLSATATLAHAAPLLAILWPACVQRGWTMSRPVIATQARVAMGDEIGAALKARLVLMLIGERPGLSSPDSLGAYLTFGPQVGRRDHERNCVSNIRPAGLPLRRAADNLLWLISEALRRGETGIALKDESAQAEILPPGPTLP